MKTILLKFDEPFFYKMRKHKMEMEHRANKKITWEDYIYLLFGFNKRYTKIKW